MDLYLLYEWLPSAILLFVVFFFLKRYEQRRGVAVLRKFLAVLLCLHLVAICSILLHEVLMFVFDIDTHGFMNLNSLLVFLLVWIVVAVVTLLLVLRSKELLATYYRVIKIALISFVSLPIVAFLIFYLAVAFKVSGATPSRQISELSAEQRYYVWNIEGLSMFSNGEGGKKIERVLPYGAAVDILVAASDPVYHVVLYNDASYRIKREGLVRFPPPVRTEWALDLQQYLESYFSVLSELDEGLTEEFCSRKTTTFGDGITYVFTDFGPCEQCGHGREEIYIPGLELHEAQTIARVLLELQLSSDQDVFTHSETEDGMEGELVTEYGMSLGVKVTSHRAGYLFSLDFFL